MPRPPPRDLDMRGTLAYEYSERFSRNSVTASFSFAHVSVRIIISIFDSVIKSYKSSTLFVKERMFCRQVETGRTAAEVFGKDGTYSGPFLLFSRNGLTSMPLGQTSGRNNFSAVGESHLIWKEEYQSYRVFSFVTVGPIPVFLKIKF